MLQESNTTTWDLRYIYHPVSASLKLYMLFLFVVCILASVKLVRIWRTAPPFRLSRKAGSPAYLRLLETSSSSLGQWSRLTLLVGGIFASVSLYDACNGLLNSKVIGSWALLFVFQDFSTTLTMALIVMLFLHLVRWHLLKRIECLRDMPE